MKQIKIENDTIVSKVRKGNSTFFLTDKRIETIIPILQKENIIYNVFYPYNGATYGVIYSNNLNVSLLQIKAGLPLTHRQIMGSIYSLNIKNNLIGDIIIDKNSYYITVIGHMKDYIINNICQIGKSTVTIKEVPLSTVLSYEPKYEMCTTTVSSLRIDTVVAKIIGTSRNHIIDKFKNKEITLNYNIFQKNDYNLKENDVFSIRKYGKYKLTEIIAKSKKDKYIILYQKYV